MLKCVLALALGLVGGVLVGNLERHGPNRMGANHRLHCRA
jgi:hypothetical protein